MVVALWHKDYGFLRMAEGTDNQWTRVDGEKFGQFVSDYMAMIVNLPLSEVLLTHI